MAHGLNNLTRLFCLHCLWSSRSLLAVSLTTPPLFPHVQQVCTAVAVDVLSGGRMNILGGRGRIFRTVFRVGRLDSLTPSPPNQLPAATATTQTLSTFWSQRGFTMSEAMALMGTHALIDDQVLDTTPHACLHGLVYPDVLKVGQAVTPILS